MSDLEDDLADIAMTDTERADMLQAVVNDQRHTISVIREALRMALDTWGDETMYPLTTAQVKAALKLAKAGNP